MANLLTDVPANFKPIQHYLKTAAEQDSRDPVLAYYCRLYAMQKGMEIDKKSPECRDFLRNLMSYLETMKTQLGDNDSIKTELVGQAHVEDFAFKLFFYADTEDRKGNAGKNVVKAFYTSSMLFDVLTTFGELSEEVDKSRRYAKWKAAYIHNCLKVGSTPQPGPLAEAAEELGISADYQFNQPKRSISPGGQSHSSQQPPPGQSGYPSSSSSSSYPSFPTPSHETHPAKPAAAAASSKLAGMTIGSSSSSGGGGSSGHTAASVVPPEAFAQAMKYCKYANSALQYEDAATAVTNLSKALALLTRQA